MHSLPPPPVARAGASQSTDVGLIDLQPVASFAGQAPDKKERRGEGRVKMLFSRLGLLFYNSLSIFGWCPCHRPPS